MAKIKFLILEDDVGKRDSAFKFNQIVQDLILESHNVPDNFITIEMIDQDSIYNLNEAAHTWSILTNGIVDAPDPDNVGVREISVMQAILPASNPAELDETDIIPKLLFDATTAESVSFTFRLPEDYHSGIKINLEFTNSATSGGVSFDVSVMATSDGDASPYSASYATANNIDATVDGTTLYLNTAQADLSNDDSLAAGDRILIKIERAVSDSNDTATGDTGLVGVMFQYYKALQTSPIYWRGDVIEIEEVPA